jgi:hypothetical protein
MECLAVPVTTTMGLDNPAMLKYASTYLVASDVMRRPYDLAKTVKDWKQIRRFFCKKDEAGEL